MPPAAYCLFVWAKLEPGSHSHDSLLQTTKARSIFTKIEAFSFSTSIRTDLTSLCMMSKGVIDALLLFVDTSQLYGYYQHDVIGTDNWYGPGLK